MTFNGIAPGDDRGNQPVGSRRKIRQGFIQNSNVSSRSEKNLSFFLNFARMSFIANNFKRERT